MVAETALLLRRRRRVFLSGAAAARFGGHHHHRHHRDDILNSTSNGSAETELEVHTKTLTVDIVDDMGRDHSHSHNGRDLHARGNGFSSTADTPAAPPGRGFYDETPRTGNGSAQETVNQKQAQEEYYRRRRQWQNHLEQRQDQDLESERQQQQQQQKQPQHQGPEQKDQEQQYELFLQSVQFIKHFMEYHNIAAPGISKSSSTLSSSSSSSTTTTGDRPEPLKEFVRRCKQGLVEHYNDDLSLLATTKSGGSKSEDDSLEREMSQLHDITNELTKELEAITLDVTPQRVATNEDVTNNNHRVDASRYFTSRQSVSSESSRGRRSMSRIHKTYRQYSQKLARSKELNMEQQQQQQRQPQNKDVELAKEQSCHDKAECHRIQSDKTATTVPLFIPQKIKTNKIVQSAHDQPTTSKSTDDENCEIPAESELTLGPTATLSSLSWVDADSSNHSRSSHLANRVEFDDSKLTQKREGTDQSQNENHGPSVEGENQLSTKAKRLDDVASHQNGNSPKITPKEYFSLTDSEPKNRNIFQSDPRFMLDQSAEPFVCPTMSADQENRLHSAIEEKAALDTLRYQEENEPLRSDSFMVSQDHKRTTVVEKSTDQRFHETFNGEREPCRPRVNQNLTPDITQNTEDSTGPKVKPTGRTLRIPETVRARNSIGRRCYRMTPDEGPKKLPEDARLAKVLSESLQRFKSDRNMAESSGQKLSPGTSSRLSMPFDETGMDVDLNCIDEKTSFANIRDDGNVAEEKLMQELFTVEDSNGTPTGGDLVDCFDLTSVPVDKTGEIKMFDINIRQIPKTWSLSPVISGFTDPSEGLEGMDLDDDSSDSGVSSFFSVDEIPQVMVENNEVMTDEGTRGQSIIQQMSKNDNEDCAENNVLKPIGANHQQTNKPLYKPSSPPQDTPQILLKYWDMVGKRENKNHLQTPRDMGCKMPQRSPLNDLVMDHSLLDESSDECSEDGTTSVQGDNNTSYVSPSDVFDRNHYLFSSNTGLSGSSIAFAESVEIPGRQVETLTEPERTDHAELRLKEAGVSSNDSGRHNSSDRHENHSGITEAGHGVDAVELVMGSSQPLESTNNKKSEPSTVPWMKIYTEKEMETTEEEPTKSPISQPAAKYYTKKRSADYPPPLAEDRHPMFDKKRNHSGRNQFENDALPETRRPTKRVKTDDISISGCLCTAASVFVDWTETTAKNIKLPDCGGKSHLRSTTKKRSSTRTTSRKQLTNRTPKTWREAIPLDWKDLNRAYEKRPSPTNKTNETRTEAISLDWKDLNRAHERRPVWG